MNLVLSLSKDGYRIADGDMLLFRRDAGSIAGWLISLAGRSEFAHAGMAAWIGGQLCCLDTVQGKGGRKTPLIWLVSQFPGQILVRKTHCRFSRRHAVAKMRKIARKSYGWWALLRASLVHQPIIRLLLWRYLLPFLVVDNNNGSLPFCSMAVSRALRAGGLDPVPNLGDAWTEPGDLYRSAAFYDWAYLYP